MSPQLATLTDDDLDPELGLVDALAQQNHEARHAEPSDTLYAATCRRRPCRDLALSPLLGQSRG